MAETADGCLSYSAPSAVAPGDATVCGADPLRSPPLANEIAALSEALTGYELTSDQLCMIARVVRPRPRGHGYDLKASIPILPEKRLYVRLLFGSERRNDERLRREGQTALHRVAFVQSAVVLLVLGYSAFGVLCSAYILKSLMRIDLMPGPSPLHALYQAFVL